jgi:signal transduction histidine kinase/ligand-binding sensor domain-containing protein/DNA-binding response OmpR family regulator
MPVFVSALVISTLGWGQYPGEGEYKFIHLDANKGLSHNQINCFLRDKKGFLWAGTASGLNRFDGYTFKVFLNRTQDSTSLIENSINKLFEDPDGRIWVTTYFGVCVYNHQFENFDRNPNRLLEEYGIPEGGINDIISDHLGMYWFIHQNAGLFRYDPSKKQSVQVRYKPNDIISSIAVDKKTNNVWVIYQSGTFEEINTETYEVLYSNRELVQVHNTEFPGFNLCADQDGDLWIYAGNINLGLFYFKIKDRSITHIHKSSKGARLNSNIVRNIGVAKNAVVWVGTDHGGVNLIDKSTWTIQYIVNDPGDDKSLSQNSINTLYIDYQDIIWIGTFKKGVSYYHENLTKFQLYRNRLNDSSSLPYDDINAFAEDKNGNIWIGTNGGGLIYFDRKANRFRQYRNDPANPNSLGNNVIVSLMTDHEDKLWIGMYYGGVDYFDGKKFTHFRSRKTDPETLSDDNAWSLLEDDEHNIWVGTLVGGLNRFDRETQKFKRFGTAQGIHTGYVPSLLQDSEGNFWVGTGYGISLKRKSDEKFRHILSDNTPGSLSNNSITALFQDSRGWVWIGTQDGLNVYDNVRKSFRNFRLEDGLPNNAIAGIAEDNKHTLWISTSNGISNLMIDSTASFDQFIPRFKNYDESDGLQGRHFNSRSLLATSNGELIFGGPNGFNLVMPGELIQNTNRPSVVLLGFQIFNKTVNVGEQVDGEVILKKSISETKSITLKHNQNIFSIDFAALSFFHPLKNQYRYKLNGFNEDWLTTDGSSRKVTYTNLDPGEYTFRVVAANNDGIWNESGATLNITVLPPFWKTKVAMAIYLFVMLGALMLTRKVILQRERMKVKVRQEREEARRIHELDMLKIKFFTNVSHEFRTPLTLILTPLERMMKHIKDPADKNHLHLVHRNARRLLNLVNQLLDFRKLEVEEVKLNQAAGDVIHFIREVATSFSDLSEKKNIGFSFNSTVERLDALFDHNKLERILFNLISNAFKFTPEGGKVDVDVAVINENTVRWVQIRVKDTGIGIPDDKKEMIFDRFFQHDTPVNMVNQGSGIGLSITKEFVRIHGGTISVESEPEKGTCFTVTIPLKEQFTDSAPEVIPESTLELTLQKAITDHHKGEHRKPVLLLVEDNEDFRFYLKDNLRHRYQILEAGNGKDGWQQAVTQIPDLIVSDVMMPEMDGADLCRKIRNDARTSHIPLILLTARAAEDQVKEGFDLGADDYVTKPFSFEILLSRIKNLLARRTQFQKSFVNKLEIKTSEIKVSSLDEKLIEKAIRYVEAKISDADFSVEDLSHELGMSRVHLYKKLVSLTGKSPIEFIRTIRLQHAAQLLEKSQLTVAEVAYKVGFNNPKYFAKYFKEHFNTLPSLYASNKKTQ